MANGYPEWLTSSVTLPDPNICLDKLTPIIEQAKAAIQVGGYAGVSAILNDEKLVTDLGFSYNRAMAVFKPLAELMASPGVALNELKERFKFKRNDAEDRNNYGYVWMAKMLATDVEFDGNPDTKIQSLPVPPRFEHELALLALRTSIQMRLCLEHPEMNDSELEIAAVTEMIDRGLKLTRNFLEPYTEEFKAHPIQNKPIVIEY